VAEPRGEQAQHDGAADIAAGRRPLAVCTRISVCRLKAEKGGVAAADAVMKNCRCVGLSTNRPSAAVSVAKKPITKQPVTLTSTVPRGSLRPWRW